MYNRSKELLTGNETTMASGSETQEALSIEEIHDRYDSEWVLIDDPKLTEMNEVISGRVLWHSRDRHEIHRKHRNLRPKRSAILYTGSPPPDMEFAL